LDKLADEALSYYDKLSLTRNNFRVIAMLTTIYSDRSARPVLSRSLQQAVAFGRWVYIVGGLVALFALAVDVYVWVAPARIEDFVALPLGIGGQVTISPSVQAAGLLLALVPLAIGLYALLQVRRLCRALLGPAVFSEALIGTLRRFAFALMALAMCELLVRTGNTIALTYFNPPGRRLLLIGIGSDTLLQVVVALLLLALAAVLREAATIAADHQQFV
jgi:hypothetical protein